jgi:hypothetical protein
MRGALCSSVLLVASCGGQSTHPPGESTPPPSTVASDDTVGFTPTSVTATRHADACDDPDPPFEDGDIFSLEAIGSKAKSPYDALTANITSPSPAIVGEPLSLTVNSYMPGALCSEPVGGPETCYGGQVASYGTLALGYSQGWDPSEIDTGAFDVATITVVNMPTEDGEPLTVRIQLHFVDGRVLDETFSGPLSTQASGCGAG